VSAMIRVTLTKIKFGLIRLRKPIILLIGILLILILLWPSIRHGLVLLAYQWQALKPPQKTIDYPVFDQTAFSKVSVPGDDWVFDSRLPFITEPGYVFSAAAAYTGMTESSKKTLRDKLRYTEKATYQQSASEEIWSENGSTLMINIENGVISYATGINLNPKLIETGDVLSKEGAVQFAVDWIKAALPSYQLLEKTNMEAFYLSFDAVSGYRITDERGKADVVLVNTVIKIGEESLITDKNYYQLAIAKKNTVVLFEFNPISLTVQPYPYYLKNGAEIKTAVRANEGVLAASCPPSQIAAQIRLNNPKLAYMRIADSLVIQPVYHFSVTIKSDASSCAGSYIIPALKNKYYSGYK